MKNILLLALFSFVASAALANDDHADMHDHKEHINHSDPHAHPEENHHDENHHNESHQDDSHHTDKHDEERVSTINNILAKQLSIISQRAGPQSLRQSITSYGRLSTAPEQSSHVRARFSGVITSVNASIGDKVKTGDLLAEVESNQSLKKYRIRAPIDGTIVQRHANVGEITREQILFSISNFEPLWAELRIFPSQRASVHAGQKLFIQTGSSTIRAEIAHIIPALDNKPYVIARAKITHVDASLAPGLMIEGRIITGEFDVAIAVNNNAIQSLQGQSGVFVKHRSAPTPDHNHQHKTEPQAQSDYTFTPLILGRRDDHYTEILSGLSAGSEYVVENSYLIKADIEKSEAKHEH